MQGQQIAQQTTCEPSTLLGMSSEQTRQQLQAITDQLKGLAGDLPTLERRARTAHATVADTLTPGVPHSDRVSRAV